MTRRDEGPWPVEAGWSGRVVELTKPPMEGPDIERWREQMKARGYDTSADKPGTFGRASLAALTAFERAHGLCPTGTLDAEAWSAAWKAPWPDDEKALAAADAATIDAPTP